MSALEFTMINKRGGVHGVSGGLSLSPLESHRRGMNTDTNMAIYTHLGNDYPGGSPGPPFVCFIPHRGSPKPAEDKNKYYLLFVARRSSLVALILTSARRPLAHPHVYRSDCIDTKDYQEKKNRLGKVSVRLFSRNSPLARQRPKAARCLQWQQHGWRSIIKGCDPVKDK